MQERKGIRILVIDDDDIFRHVMRIHLTHAGYKVETAEDAIEGGKAMLASPPDLIICDINMPHMDGMELQSLLRTDPRTASIPFIFASARSEVDIMVKALDSGAIDYLHKPVTLERLLEAVAAVVGKAEGES